MATAETGRRVGLVIVTHEECGAWLLRAAGDIVGPVASSTAVSVPPGEKFEEIVRHVS